MEWGLYALSKLLFANLNVKIKDLLHRLPVFTAFIP